MKPIVLPGGELVFDARIGSGSAGKLYSAILGNAQVAVKVYRPDPDDYEYFYNEVNVLEKLGSNKNIVRLIGFCFLNDTTPTPCMIMELANFSLRFLLNSNVDSSGNCNGLPLSRCKNIIRGVLSGLKHIHAAGYVHADIKPGNVLLTADSDEAKLCDFESASELPGTHSLVGTSSYISPEIALENNYDTSTDIWSTCVMLYEMISGDFLFEVHDSSTEYYGGDWEWTGDLAEGDSSDGADDEINTDEIPELVPADHGEEKPTNKDTGDSQHVSADCPDRSEENPTDKNHGEEKFAVGDCANRSNPTNQHNDGDHQCTGDDCEDCNQAVDESSLSESSEDTIKITSGRLLVLAVKIIGKAPEEFAATKGASKYFTPDGTLRDYPNLHQSAVGVTGLLCHRGQVHSTVESCIGSASQFVNLGLKFLPKDRATADEMLAHEWLKN